MNFVEYVRHKIKNESEKHAKLFIPVLHDFRYEVFVPICHRITDYFREEITLDKTHLF